MSYAVDIVSVPVPDSDGEAWELRDALLDAWDGKTGPLPKRVETLHRRLSARFPCLTEGS
jgi:hypothetical protein